MPRIAKPYKKGDFYVTSAGGTPHQKLCPVSEGEGRARELLQALLARRQGLGWTVPAAVENFLAFKRGQKAAGTVQWYEEKLGVLRDYFGEHFPGLTLKDLAPEMGVRFQNWLLKEKEWRRGNEARRGVSRSTCNGYLRAAKALLNWCGRPGQRAQSGLASNPWAEFESSVPGGGRERVISEEELATLLAQCRSAWHGGMLDREVDFQDQILVLRHTTLRPNELRALRWEYISWDAHQIIFPAHVVKTRKRREVTLLDPTEKLLRARRERLRSRGAACAEGDFVFCKPGKDGEGRTVAGLGQLPVASGSLAQRFRRLFLKCVALGLIAREKRGERLVPYSTRHSRISELVREGHQPSIIMREAGHSSPLTTERYVHLAGTEVADRIREGGRV